MIPAVAIFKILDEARERHSHAHILMERDEYVLAFSPRKVSLTSRSGWTNVTTWGDSAEWMRGDVTIRIDILRSHKVVAFLSFRIKDVYKAALVEGIGSDAVIIREVE